jgi:hypothetical protein
MYFTLLWSQPNIFHCQFRTNNRILTTYHMSQSILRWSDRQPSVHTSHDRIKQPLTSNIITLRVLYVPVEHRWAKRLWKRWQLVHYLTCKFVTNYPPFPNKPTKADTPPRQQSFPLSVIADVYTKFLLVKITKKLVHFLVHIATIAS